MVDAGGLFVLGTERHESRRIDNQLRGRSGRQGDPGASNFFLSLEDDLMRIFGSERMDSMLQRLGLKEGEAIIHPWVNKALEKAQQKVEARNYDIRKNLLKYDDVMNDQRKVVYEQRREIMMRATSPQTVADMRSETIDEMVAQRDPGEFARRAVGHAGAARRVPAPLRARPAARRMGQGRGHRRRRDPRAPHRRGRPQDGREGGQLRPRPHAHGREEPAAAAPRPDLEGPPPDRSTICARASTCAPMPSATR